jgi:hypothetical protein
MESMGREVRQLLSFTSRCQWNSLSYVIRENDEPARDANFDDFVTKTIACAPLNGEFYEADRMTVFNFLVSFTTDQPFGDWIKSTLRYNNGRRSMKALRNHFAGEGNASRNKAEADRLKESLHYKNERAMTFEIFLTQCQKMYNIYEKEEEGMSEDAKIRFLFKRIQHPALQPAIEALKVKQSTNEDLTYSQVANHMATAVSELPGRSRLKRVVTEFFAGLRSGFSLTKFPKNSVTTTTRRCQ